MDILNELYEKGVNRRNFLMGAGALSAATVLAGCGNSGTVTPTPTPTPTPAPGPAAITDADILNFALNLEYLEAEFYLRAATGSGLAASDVAGTGAAGSVTGGKKVGGTLTKFQSDFINELAYDEQQHVKFLRSQLGASAVARPAIDLTAGFSGAVAAANTVGTASASLPLIPPGFDPFGDFDSFLVASFVFEDVGVTAYTGAGPLLSAAAATNGTLLAAGGLQAVEAYHAAAIRTQLTGKAIIFGTNAYPYPLFANRISGLRAALGGGKETPLSGFLQAPATTATVTASSIVAADAMALAYSRSVSEVLHIVYGTFSTTAGSTTSSAGVKSGLFFPAGLNGTITTTTA